MLNPFIDLIASVLQIYMWCVVIWTVTSVLISFKVINSYQPLVQRVMYALDKICEPVMRPIRKILPDLGGIDVSPIIVILLITFLQNALYTYFYTYEIKANISSMYR
ncbi:MAG: YggT family protein [Rickettsiales bacterium]